MIGLKSPVLNSENSNTTLKDLLETGLKQNDNSVGLTATLKHIKELIFLNAAEKFDWNSLLDESKPKRGTFSGAILFILNDIPASESKYGHSNNRENFNVGLEIVERVLTSDWQKIQWTGYNFRELLILVIKSPKPTIVNYFNLIAALPNIDWNFQPPNKDCTYYLYQNAITKLPNQTPELFERIINSPSLIWFESELRGLNEFAYKNITYSAAVHKKILAIISSLIKINADIKFHGLTVVVDQLCWEWPRGERVHAFCKQYLTYAIEAPQVNWSHWLSVDVNNRTTIFAQMLEAALGGNPAAFEIIQKLVLAQRVLWDQTHLCKLLAKTVRNDTWWPILKDLILSNPLLMYNFIWSDYPVPIIDSLRDSAPALLVKYESAVLTSKQALRPATRKQYIHDLIAFNASQQDALYKDGARFDDLVDDVRGLIFSFLRPGRPDIKIDNFEEIFASNCKPEKNERVWVE